MSEGLDPLPRREADGTGGAFVMPSIGATFSGIEESPAESRFYKAPLTRVGPLRSGSLREFGDEKL